MSLSDDKQADIIDAFNTTSRYLGDILNINNVYFDNSWQSELKKRCIFLVLLAFFSTFVRPLLT